jgi:pimeloyl-ACP methyl ester carboxylesterase
MNSSSTFPIPYIDFGGSGISIHFSHANGYPPACYQPLLALLSREYHVISMLQRPLWPDSNPEEIKDWRPFTTDLLAFLDQQSLNSSIAIGHSLGGITSLRAAILEPNLFKALVLIDPVLFSPKFILARRLIWSMDMVYRYHPLIKATRYRRREFADLESLFTGFRHKPVFRYMDDDSLRAYVKGITTPKPGGGYRLTFSPEWEMRIYATGIWKDMDLWRKIHNLKIPVLVIRGAETDTFLSPAARLLKKRLPAVSLVTLEKTTHLVPLEGPDEVYNTIVKFLQEKL